MNLLFSCIGQRGYIADFFRENMIDRDKIIGTSNTQWTAGFSACNKGVVLPSIDDNGYIKVVLDLCKKERVDGILSFFDLDVYELSKARDKFLEAGVMPIFPSLDVSEICFDKWLFSKFLSANNFDTARTFLTTESALEAIDNKELDYPLYLKPRRGFGSYNTFLAGNKQQLIAFFSLAKDMIIQEQLVGDAYNFDLLCDFNGKVLSVIPWRRHLSKMGETKQAETVEFPELVKVAKRLGTLLKFIGPVDADVILTEDKLATLEINPRFGGGYPVSHLAGASFPKKIIRLLRGETVQSDADYVRGVMMMKKFQIMGGVTDQFLHNELNFIP